MTLDSETNYELFIRARDELAALKQHYSALVAAAESMANEVGCLNAFEVSIREELGNTNWECLVQRRDALRTALDALKANQ